MEPTASCVYTINVRIHVNTLVSVCTTFLKQEVLTFILLNVDVKDIRETWKSCCMPSSIVSPEQLHNVNSSRTEAPGVLGSWGENLFILKGAGRSSNDFKGAREQALNSREMGSTTYDVLLQYLALASMCYSLLSFYNELWFR